MFRSALVRLSSLFFLGILGVSSTYAAHMELKRLNAGKLAISLTGPINIGDAKKFMALSNVAGVKLVVLHSLGGATMDAIVMGRIIRAKGFDTLVGQGQLCFSACALIWMAGRKRYMSRYALIGAHASYIRDENGVAQPSGEGNAIVGAYLRDLGLSIPAIRYMTMGKPKQIYPINEQIARDLKIDVIVLEYYKKRPESKNVASSDAVVIMKTFFSALSMAGDLKYLSHIEKMIDDRVEYYNNFPIPRNEVLYKIYKYTKKWPIRYFFVRDNTVEFQCFQNNCEITGIVDWAAANPARYRLSYGKSFYRVSVNYKGKIYSIQGKVIQARRLKGVQIDRIRQAIWRLEKKHRARLWKVVKMLETGF